MALFQAKIIVESKKDYHKMFSNKFIKLNPIKLTIITSFVACILSISTTFQDLLIFKDFEKLNIYGSINFLRHFSIYFFFFILSSGFLYLLVNNKIYFKKNLFLYFFIIYFIFQIPGLFVTGNNIENISLIVSSITFILTIISFNHIFSDKEKIFFIYILFLILSLVFILSFSQKFYVFIRGEGPLYGQLFQNAEPFLLKDAPRSSGISRTALILIILGNFLFYKKNSKRTILSEVFTISLLSIILLFQSRTMIALSIIVIIISFIYDNKLYLINFFRYFLLYIFFPVLLTLVINTIHTYKYYSLDIQTRIANGYDKVSEQNTKANKFKIVTKFNIRPIDKQSFSSGRTKDWKEIFEKFEKKNFIFGYGSQGDRYLINQSASNALIYAFVSSGILGFIFFFLFSFIIFLLMANTFLISKKNNLLDYSYSLVILIILIRSLIESSYSHYGIDFIVLVTLIPFLKSFKLNKIK